MLSQSPSNMGKFEPTGKDDAGPHKSGKKGHSRMDSHADPVAPKPITRVIKFGAETNTTALPAEAAAAAAAAAAGGAAGMRNGAAAVADAKNAVAAAHAAAAASSSGVAPGAVISSAGQRLSTDSTAVNLFAKETILPRVPPAANKDGSANGSLLSRELSETGMLRSFNRAPNATINDKNGGVSISGGFMHGGGDDRNGTGRDGRDGPSGRGDPNDRRNAPNNNDDGSGSARNKQPTSPNAAAAGGAAAAGKESKLKVFISLNGETVGPALKLMVNDQLRVSEVVLVICREYAKQNRQPPLVHAAYGSDAYELRMVDDEEGTPDDDLPPLGAGTAIGKIAVDAVALVPKSGFVPPAGGGAVSIPTKDAKSGAGNGGISGAGSPAGPRGRGESTAVNAAGVSDKKLLKIHMHQETHMLQCPRDTVLEDLLAMISKKKKLKLLLPKAYKFLYMSEAESSEGTLEMRTSVAELKSEELRLVNKFQGAAGGGGGAGAEDDTKYGVMMSATAAVSTDPDPSSFVFTAETAGAYSEYKVIKTNNRGRKQNRVMGVDKQFIYNKQETEQRDSSGSSAAGSSMQSKAASFFSSITAKSTSVAKEKRPMTSVASCALIKGKPRMFQVTFKDDKGDANREYEAETKMEAAEIVAKINFLMKNQK